MSRTVRSLDSPWVRSENDKCCGWCCLLVIRPDWIDPDLHCTIRPVRYCDGHVPICQPTPRLSNSSLLKNTTRAIHLRHPPFLSSSTPFSDHVGPKSCRGTQPTPRPDYRHRDPHTLVSVARMDEKLPMGWLTSVSTEPLHPWCLELRVRPGTVSYTVVQPISKTIHDPSTLSAL